MYADFGNYFMTNFELGLIFLLVRSVDINLNKPSSHVEVLSTTHPYFING